ncbi:MAG: CDP-diacylglycerol--glycerol-3-phosphate 3-phosphatidyltransferase [Gammaproteobacteria bacterium]
MTIPNYLSLFRIILIPVMVAVYFIPFQWAHMLAAAIFALAAFTDLIDGFLARLLGQITPLGEFLDPVADKLIVATAIILIISHGRMPYLTLPALIIVGREIAVSALREWMAELGKRASVAVSFMGKIKTAVQMISLIILLALHPDSTRWLFFGGYLLFYAAALLTLWSMCVYFKAAWPMLIKANESV